MFIIDDHRHTALVVGHGKRGVAIVPMTGGELRVKRISRKELDLHYRQKPIDLVEAVDRFLDAGRRHGMTQEAEASLRQLRDRAAQLEFQF